MRKLLLINPVSRRSGFLLSRFSTLPPLSLAYVAAVTPKNWVVKILDENFDEFSYEDADLIGITAFTSNINRAYQIAQIYRQRNKTVVLGGIHASMNPEEALVFADAVVMGEAEGIWGDVIKDFEKNSLKTRYSGKRLDLEHFSIVPRHDLLHPKYLWHSVQTSRGCPFDCNFCTVSKYNGLHYRQRNVKDVLDEISTLPGKYITFVDDNLLGYGPAGQGRAKDLFQGMIDRGFNKRWWMQTSINAASDEKVLELAAKSGCLFAFIGFETIENASLEKMGKNVNLKVGIDNYREVVRKFHKYGIGVLGSFIVGNDYENQKYYASLANFMIKVGIDIFQISTLTPLPGTDLMNELRSEGRILYNDYPSDWDKYRFSYMVHQPKGTDVETIYEGNNLIKSKLYSFPFFHYRLIRSFFQLRNIDNFKAVLLMNKSYKRAWQNSHYAKVVKQ